jgi:uncharacterized protein involved in response to NO
MIGDMWRREPFRILFPLGIALAWVGIGHWIAYWAGWIGTYSCTAHGLVQIQGFLLAFALGFLLTAIPRRTASAPASAAAVVGAGLALVVSSGAVFLDRWWVAEGCTIAVLVGVVAFARRRFVAGGGGRRPPAAFVLLPLGLACAAGGALCVVWGTTPGASPTALVLGRLLVTQGCFLCLVMGAGALVIPLMSGAPPPPDIGTSPEVARAAAAYLAAGVAVVATLVAEAFGSDRVAPLVRGLLVGATLVRGAGVLRPLALPGTNRRVARLAALLVPAGPILAGLAPDHRVPALHVTFIGGFGLLALSVATHVTASHCEGLPEIRDGRSTIVRVVAVGVLLAALGRFTADATATYFEHLAAAAAAWIVATALWTARLSAAWLGDGHRGAEGEATSRGPRS